MNWEQKYDALASMIEGYRHERNEALERLRLLEAEVERVNAREDATRRELSETRIDMRDMERERDEARAETARLRRLLNMAEDELVAADDHGRREAKRADNVEAEVEALKAERDEARAEADRWKRSCNVFRERDWPKAFQATVTSLEQEVSDAHEQLAKLRKLSKPWEGDAYRRGAEAMREACARWMSEREGISQWVYDDALSALPIPEEK